MNRISPHELLARHELQIPKRDVLFVSVFENDCMPRGNRAVFLFPDAHVFLLPSEAAEPGPRGFRDFPFVVAVCVAAIHAHQGSDRHGGMRHLTFLELRLAHAAAAD